MTTRHVTVQAFVYVVSLTLLIMGSVGLVDRLTGQSITCVSVTGIALIILTGSATFAAERGWTWLRQGCALAIIALAAHLLYRYLSLPEPKTIVPIPALVFALLGLAILPVRPGRASRALATALALGALALAVWMLIYDLDPARFAQCRFPSYRIRTGGLVLALCAMAAVIMTRLPHIRPIQFTEHIQMPVFTGILFYVSAWFLLTQNAGNAEQALLANATLLIGVTLMIFLLVTLMLAHHAKSNADQVAVQRDTMALIARTEELPTMLQAICTMVESSERDSVCTIHGLAPDGRSLELLAAPTTPPELREVMQRIDVAEGAGACGTAAWRKDMVIVPDIATHPYFLPYRALLRNYRLQTCYSQPIMALEGYVLGTVALYLPKAGLPTSEQRQLLTSAAQFAAVAIERAAARLRIQNSEQRYRSLYVYNPDAVYALDTDGFYTSMNPRGLQMMGLAEQQIIGQHHTLLVSPENLAEAENRFQAALAGQAQHYELPSRDGQGRLIDLEITNMPIMVNGAAVGVFGIAKDVTRRNSIAMALQERNQQLAHNANHDQLTGLPNRRLLEVCLQRACQSARPGGHGIAVVFYDLDGFKPLNDSLGHGAGDRILREVAQRMRENVRPQDTVARLSGDEFVMVLQDLTPAQAELITQRTINAIGQPYDLPQGWQHLTASAGIAYTEQPYDDPMQLVRAADLAMYEAKHKGRNSYQWHTDDMSRQAQDRVRMRNDLQEAMETNGLIIHYQPKFDRSMRKVVGIEALSRWHCPQRGWVPATEFIQVAEETGQIVQLGAWALETACVDNQYLRTQGYTQLSVAVNISPVQFQRNHFCNDVKSVLKRTGLPPEYLELEITESVLLNHTDTAIHTLTELKNLGVRISIDDFGTGFSSLSYLKNLPIDQMKIDRSFVSEVPHDEDDAAITLAIIALAHNLGLKTVAEGVETREQLDFLLCNGCDEFQGYLLSHPMPLAELLAFLRDQAAVT